MEKKVEARYDVPCWNIGHLDLDPEISLQLHLGQCSASTGYTYTDLVIEDHNFANALNFRVAHNCWRSFIKSSELENL